MIDIAGMDAHELVQRSLDKSDLEIGPNSPLGRARKVLYHGMAKIEQAEGQVRPPSYNELFKMQFALVAAIRDELNK